MYPCLALILDDDFAKSHIQREREVIYQLFFSTWNHLVFFGCNVFRDSTRQRHCPECLENIQAPIESVRIFNIYFSSLIYTSESYEGSVDVDDYVKRWQALWNKLKDIIGLMSFYRLSKFRKSLEEWKGCFHWHPLRLNSLKAISFLTSPKRTAVVKKIRCDHFSKFLRTCTPW